MVSPLHTFTPPRLALGRKRVWGVNLALSSDLIAGGRKHQRAEPLADRRIIILRLFSGTILPHDGMLSIT